MFEISQKMRQPTPLVVGVIPIPLRFRHEHPPEREMSIMSASVVEEIGFSHVSSTRVNNNMKVSMTVDKGGKGKVGRIVPDGPPGATGWAKACRRPCRLHVVHGLDDASHTVMYTSTRGNSTGRGTTFVFQR